VPQANFELIPDAGHVANADNPAAFTAALERFFG
jgi:pimeloyl-ACP methyl ester carboxylesterase